jgi:hypothetical protein
LFFRLSVEQRNICRYRLRFLKYWDRLSTYEAILGGPAVAHDTFDSDFFSKFRDSNIVETSVKFARVSCFHHVSILSKLSQPNCGHWREIVCVYLVFCVLYAKQSLLIACRVVSRSFGVTILRANTFTSEIVGSILGTDSCEKSPSTLCWKSWVFSGCSGFLPQGKLTGWVGISPPNWPFHRSCVPWSDMSHKVATRGALRKPSTRSGWAASFVIELSSQ